MKSIRQLKQLIHEEYRQILSEDEKLKEGVVDWISGVASRLAAGILNKRAGYLSVAVAKDKKLRKLAKDLKIDSKDFEKRVNSLMDKDPAFLQALSTQRAKSPSKF